MDGRKVKKNVDTPEKRCIILCYEVLMILTIDKTKAKAACLSDSFVNMGLPSVACTPKEALSKISPLYRAVIITTPESIADIADLTVRLRRYMLSVPIFALCSRECEHADCFDEVFPVGSYAPTVLDGIISYCTERTLAVPGVYALAGIDASISLPTPRYFWDAIPLTKTEALLLRTLIRAYPMPMQAKDIVEHIYRPGRMPEPSNTRTHISLMNKKFREITGRNLIEAEFGSGYRILTPEFSTVRV